MNRCSTSCGRLTAPVLMLTLIVTSPAAVIAQSTHPQYEVTELPVLAGHPFTRTARINSQGEAVGGAWVCRFILSCLGRGVLYDANGVHDFTDGLIESLPPGSLPVTRGVDLNDEGDVLLWLTLVDVGVFPYLWRDGEEFIEIEGPPEATITIGWALNEQGVVVGYYATATSSRAFVWAAGEGIIEVIEPPPGYVSSLGRGINDAGGVVGHFSGGSAGTRAFVWSGGRATLLPPLPGDVGSQAIDINEAGLVSGISIDTNGSESLVVWRQGEIVDSVTLEYETTWIDIHQLSNEGEIVGSYWPIFDFPQHFAFRWSGASGFEPLDTLDLSIPNLNLWQATGVNESGQIIAWGEYPDLTVGSFLLTPIPIAGDLDGDGEVSVTDLIMLITAWGACADPDLCPEDLDGDGDVGVPDLVILIGNWS